MGDFETRRHPLVRLEGEATGALLARFALPVIAGMLITRLCLIVDGVLVGQAQGDAGMAAITAAAPFVTLLNAAVMLVGDGAASVMALRLGAGDRRGAAAAMGNPLLLFAVLSLAAAASAPWWATGALALTGVEGSVLAEARDYLAITMAGTFALCFSLGIDTFLRVCGFPTRTLAVQALCAAANVALGYLLVMELGWGVRGAAVSTVASQVAALVLTVILLRCRDMPLRLRAGDLRPRGAVAGRIAALGLPSFIVRSSDAAVALLTNFLVTLYGGEVVGDAGALAVAGVVSRVSQFVLVPAIGIAVGARPLIGFAFGASDGGRTRQLVRCALVAGTVALCAAWVAVEAAAPFLTAAFGLAGETAALTATALRIGLGAMPILMVRILGTNYFQATGQAREAVALTFCQQFVILLPLIALMPLVLPAATGTSPLMAVFWGMLTADVLSTLLVAIFLACAPDATRRAKTC